MARPPYANGVEAKPARRSTMSDRVPISKRLVLINSVSSVLSRLISASILIWMYQYLLRRIDPAEYALLPIVMSIVNMLPLITIALTSGISRYIVEAYAKGDNWRVTQIVSTMTPLLVGTAAVITAGGVVLAFNVEHVLSIESEFLFDARLMLILMITAFAVEFAITPFQVGMYVRQRFVALDLVDLGTQLLKLTLLLSLLLGLGPRVLWVSIAACVAQLTNQAIRCVISVRLVPEAHFTPRAIHWPLTRSLLSFGGWSFIGQTADTLRNSTDPIVLNLLATPVDVNCFHIGSVAVRQLSILTRRALRPIQPVMTAMFATGAKDRLANTYLRGCRYGLWVTLLASVPLMIFSQPLIVLYAGSQYAEAAVVLTLLLAAGSIAHANNIMLIRLAKANAQIRSITLVAIVFQVSNLGLTLVLVGLLKMGATGSALATFLVTLLGHPLLLPMAMRMTGMRLKRWFREGLGPGLLPAAIASVPWLLLRLFRTQATWHELGLCVSVGSAVYVVTLLGFALNRDERQEARRLISAVHDWSSRVLAGRGRG